MTDLEDSSIVELYLSRDEDAIFQTSKKYGSRLRALSLGIVADRFTAEECENDTYLEAWRSIPPHEPKSYFYQFLARITRHRSLNCCRERNRLRRSAYICELTAEMEQCIAKPDDCACHIWPRGIGPSVRQRRKASDRAACPGFSGVSHRRGL